MAKKAKSSLLNMFLSLTVIAVVAAGLLALVKVVTEEPIENAQKAKTEEAIKAVLPAFAKTDTLTVNGYMCHKAFNDAGELVGVAVESFSDKGFGGRLKVMYGFDMAGTIVGYSILETAETPGLGAKADTWFQNGGKGCVVGKNPGESKLTVKKDGGEVDAISGSTITSRAFCGALDEAYKAYKVVVEQ